MSINKRLNSDQINNNLAIIAKEQKENVSCFTCSSYLLTNIKAMNRRSSEKLSGYLFNFSALLDTINKKKNFTILIPAVLNLCDDVLNLSDVMNHWVLFAMEIDFFSPCSQCKKNSAIFKTLDSLNLGSNLLNKTNLTKNKIDFLKFLNNETNSDLCVCPPFFIHVHSDNYQTDGNSCGYFMLKYAENLMIKDGAKIHGHDSELLTKDFKKLVLLRDNQITLKIEYSTSMSKLKQMRDKQIQLEKDYSTLNSRIQALQQIPDVTNIESNERIKMLNEQVCDLSKECVSLNKKNSQLQHEIQLKTQNENQTQTQNQNQIQIPTPTLLNDDKLNDVDPTQIPITTPTILNNDDLNDVDPTQIPFTTPTILNNDDLNDIDPIQIPFTTPTILNNDDLNDVDLIQIPIPITTPTPTFLHIGDLNDGGPIQIVTPTPASTLLHSDVLNDVCPIDINQYLVKPIQIVPPTPASTLLYSGILSDVDPIDINQYLIKPIENHSCNFDNSEINMINYVNNNNIPMTLTTATTTATTTTAITTPVPDMINYVNNNNNNNISMTLTTTTKTTNPIPNIEKLALDKKQSNTVLIMNVDGTIPVLFKVCNSEHVLFKYDYEKMKMFLKWDDFFTEPNTEFIQFDHLGFKKFFKIDRHELFQYIHDLKTVRKIYKFLTAISNISYAGTSHKLLFNFIMENDLSISTKKTEFFTEKKKNGLAGQYIRDWIENSNNGWLKPQKCFKVYETNQSSNSKEDKYLFLSIEVLVHTALENNFRFFEYLGLEILYSFFKTFDAELTNFKWGALENILNMLKFLVVKRYYVENNQKFITINQISSVLIKYCTLMNNNNTYDEVSNSDELDIDKYIKPDFLNKNKGSNKVKINSDLLSKIQSIGSIDHMKQINSYFFKSKEYFVIFDYIIPANFFIDLDGNILDYNSLKIKLENGMEIFNLGNNIELNLEFVYESIYKQYENIKNNQQVKVSNILLRSYLIKNVNISSVITIQQNNLVSNIDIPINTELLIESDFIANYNNSNNNDNNIEYLIQIIEKFKTESKSGNVVSYREESINLNYLTIKDIKRGDFVSVFSNKRKNNNSSDTPPNSRRKLNN